MVYITSTNSTKGRKIITKQFNECGKIKIYSKLIFCEKTTDAPGNKLLFLCLPNKFFQTHQIETDILCVLLNGLFIKGSI